MMIFKVLLPARGGLIRQAAVRNSAAVAVAAASSSMSTTTTTPARHDNTASSTVQSGGGGGGAGGVFDKIACIGTGIICQALVEPMIANGLQPATNFCMYDVNMDALTTVRTKFPGVHIATSIPQAIDNADLILLAVKPQNLTPMFFAEFQTNVQCLQSSIVLSVIAGKGMEVFRQAGFNKVVRSMPNTPATIGEGMTVWSATNNLDLKDRGKIDKMLSSCGATMYVDDESYIDMATSISGSGPAYIFLLMESMVDAGVHMGFPRDQATKLVYQTMLGSTLYAMKNHHEHPAILRNRVTSPSGTTASALYELENGKFRTVIKDAMWACYRRSLEMGGNPEYANVGPGRSSHHTPM